LSEMAKESSPTIEGESVQKMFAGIATRYDRANHFLSFGNDIYWRWRVTRMVSREKPKTVVDLATGSGDIALALAKHLPANTSIQGLDFCLEMLDEAKAKRDLKKSKSRVEFSFGDCLALPLEDASVDVLTIGFGLRNLEDRTKGMREMLRVLRPGGCLIVLEFSQPYRILSPLYYFYLKNILPFVARRITGNEEAYHYLGGTIKAFPSRKELSEQLEEQGFAVERAIALSGGIVALHRARKP